MRTYGVNQVFRFVKGISLHRQSRQILFYAENTYNLVHACATCSEHTDLLVPCIKNVRDVKSLTKSLYTPCFYIYSLSVGSEPGLSVKSLNNRTIYLNI